MASKDDNSNNIKKDVKGNKIAQEILNHEDNVVYSAGTHQPNDREQIKIISDRVISDDSLGTAEKASVDIGYINSNINSVVNSPEMGIFMESSNANSNNNVKISNNQILINASPTMNSSPIMKGLEKHSSQNIINTQSKLTKNNGKVNSDQSLRFSVNSTISKTSISDDNKKNKYHSVELMYNGRSTGQTKYLTFDPSVNFNRKKESISQIMQIMNNNENLRSDPTISTHPQPHSKRKNSIFERIMSISILKDLNGHNFKSNTINTASLSPMQESIYESEIPINRQQKSNSTNVALNRSSNISKSMVSEEKIRFSMNNNPSDNSIFSNAEYGNEANVINQTILNSKHSINISDKPEHEHPFRFDASFAEKLKKKKLLLKKTPQPQPKSILTTKEYIDELNDDDDDALNIELFKNAVENGNRDDYEYSSNHTKNKNLSSLEQYSKNADSLDSSVKHMSLYSINSSPISNNFTSEENNIFFHGKYYSTSNHPHSYKYSSSSTTGESTSSYSTTCSSYSSINEKNTSNSGSLYSKRVHGSLSRSVSSGSIGSDKKKDKLRRTKKSKNSINKNSNYVVFSNSLDNLHEKSQRHLFSLNFNKNNDKIKNSRSFSELFNFSVLKKKGNTKSSSKFENNTSSMNIGKSILQIFDLNKRANKSEDYTPRMEPLEGSGNFNRKILGSSDDLSNIEALHSSLMGSPQRYVTDSELNNPDHKGLSINSVNSSNNFKQGNLKDYGKLRNSIPSGSIKHRRHRHHMHKAKKSSLSIKENEALLKGGLQYNDEGQLISSFGMPLRRQTVAAINAFLHPSLKTSKIEMDSELDEKIPSSTSLIKDGSLVKNNNDGSLNVDIYKSSIISEDDVLFQSNFLDKRHNSYDYPSAPKIPKTPQIPISFSVTGISNLQDSKHKDIKYSSFNKSIRKRSNTLEDIKDEDAVTKQHHRHKHKSDNKKKKRRKRRGDQFVPLSMIEKSNIKDKINMQINPLVNIKNASCLGRINTNNISFTSPKMDLLFYKLINKRYNESRKVWALLNTFMIIVNSVLIITNQNFGANKLLNIILIVISTIGGLSTLLLEFFLKISKKYNKEDYIYVVSQLCLLLCSFFWIYTNALDPFFGILLFSMGDTTFRNFKVLKYGVFSLLLVFLVRTILQGSTLFSMFLLFLLPSILIMMTIHTSKKRELSFKRNFLDFKIVQLEKNNLRLRNLHQNKLLLLSLPETIVQRIQSGKDDFNSLSCRVEDASVLFLDCKGLLNILTAAPPDILPSVLTILNEYFVCLDVLIENYSSNECLTKIKTIGTKYLLAGNVLKHSDNHLFDIASIALHILKTFDPDNFFQEVDYRKEKTKLELKIGIAVGPLVTGICGSKKFLWDIWGDTCNMASRMQTTLIGSGIQVTENVYERLKDKFYFSEKMSTNIKGKGETSTYLLLDIKSNENQDIIKKNIINKINSVRKQESSLSSLSSNFNNFLKENTNKCMADDNFTIDNESVAIAKSNRVEDDNSLTYEILNDSDFEDENNSFSNSSFNIFEMNMLNRSMSCQVKKNPESNIPSHINNEIALNINQQIKNVLTNYDQIQNLQNITNRSLTSLHNNDDQNIGEYLREEDNKMNEVDDEFYSEEKPSLIKGIINRTKSYQFKGRAFSTKQKNTDYEESAPSFSHKNFNLHHLKSLHDKNRSFNSSDVYSAHSMDTNGNASVDYLSDYGMMENKISKNNTKKRGIFKSLHSFKQKSDNNLTKQSHKGSKGDELYHPTLNNSYNNGLCVSTNVISSCTEMSPIRSKGNMNSSKDDGITDKFESMSLSNRNDSNVLNSNGLQDTYYSSEDFKDCSRSTKNLVISYDVNHGKRKDDDESSSLTSPAYQIKVSEHFGDGNAPQNVTNSGSLNKFEFTSSQEVDKTELLKDSNDSLSTTDDNVNGRKVSKYSIRTNTINNASNININTKKRISFVSDTPTMKERSFNELRSFDTTNSNKRSSRSRKTSSNKNEKSVTESIIESPYDEIIEENNSTRGTTSVRRPTFVDIGEISPGARSSRGSNIIPDMYHARSRKNTNSIITTTTSTTMNHRNSNNDVIINIPPPPPSYNIGSKKTSVSTRSQREKSTQRSSSITYNRSIISSRKSTVKTNSSKDQDITRIIDTISKELEKIEDEEYYNTIAKTVMYKFTHVFKEPTLEKVYCNFLKKQFSYVSQLKKCLASPIFLLFFLLPFVLRKTVIHQHNIAKLEDKKSLQLLYNCLPEFVVQDLCKEKLSSWKARRFDGVTIFCMDVVNFTKLSSKLSPQDVIALLNEIFSEFDDLCVNGIEKYQTIGDAYQAGAGCPYPCDDHAIKMINFSREVLKVTKRFNEEHDIELIMSKNNNNLTPNISLMKKDISEPYNIHDAISSSKPLSNYESFSQVNITSTNSGNATSNKKGSFLFFNNERPLKHKIHGIDNINTSQENQNFSAQNSPLMSANPYDFKHFNGNNYSNSSNTNSNSNNINISNETDKLQINSNSNIIKIFPHVDIRIGVYSGYVFAGVIGGQKRFKFEVFGDAIDKATLLESHGVVNRIHVSQSVYEQTCNEVKYELLEKTIKEIGFNGYLVVDENND